MDVNGEGGENLANFLESISLSHYQDAIRNELKVETMQQLRQVEESDLEDIRMKPDDISKLRKNIKKEFPQSAFGKLKKMGGLNAVTRRLSMKRLTRSSSEQQAGMRNSRSSVLSTVESEAPASPVPVVGRRIIPREQIEVQSDIGQGEFGVVRHAIYTNDVGQKIEVAVKSLSQDRLEHGLQEFLKEASSMQSVSHSNIVTFYGIVFQQDKELMLVTEYAPMKSLLECLHNDSLRTTMSVTRLSAFAHQIATGMTYLEAQGLIHRDLAARNILVFSDRKVKIGDFGLSRALGLEKEYYQSKYRTDLKIPIAWCAPECINLLRFSSASDVWAFGVTMWEMFTYGKKPWDGLSSMEILKTIDNPKRQRLERPELCPTEHYNLMLKCWSHEPEERPKFASITSELTSIKPTVMKAIRASSSAPGCINFQEGDSITVIDKKPSDAPSWQYWMGVNKAGERGFFSPTDCVPVMPESSPLTSRSTKSLQAPPKSEVAQGVSDMIGKIESMKKQNTSRSPRNQEKKKFTRDMIGAPQNDLRHTGHIGYDGINFGDIPVGPEKVEKIIPIKGGSSGSSTLRSTTSDGSGSGIGATINVGPNATVNIPNGHSAHNNHSSSLSSGSSSLSPHTTLSGGGSGSIALTSSNSNHTQDSTDSGLQELEDFEFPDLSLSESLGDFGTSFIDDMMRDFKTSYSNTNENNNSAKQQSSAAASMRSDSYNGHGVRSGTCDTERISNNVSSSSSSCSVPTPSYYSHTIGMATNASAIACLDRLSSSSSSSPDNNGLIVGLVEGAASPPLYSPLPMEGYSDYCNYGSTVQHPDSYNSFVTSDSLSHTMDINTHSPPNAAAAAVTCAAKQRKKSSSKAKLTLPGPNLKSMSAADEKMINDAIELANQLASTSLSQAQTPKEFDDEPGTPSKSKHRFHFKFPGAKKTSPKADKRSFSDNLACKTEVSTVTPEAEQAYNVLVAKCRHPSSEDGHVRSIQRKSSNGKPPEIPSNPPSRIRRHSANSQHRPNSRTSVKSADRPKERPPLPPIQLVSASNTGAKANYHDDLSDMPCTPPPPVPQSPITRLPHTPSIDAVYNNMDAFWGADMPTPTHTTSSGHSAGHSANDDGNSVLHGRYKSRSDNVSYEDLLEFSEERQLLRRMQKVLVGNGGNEVSEAECRQALDKTQGDMNNAVKYIKLTQLAKLKLAGIDHCKTALVSCQWNVQRAADFILDRRAVYQNDVIGV